MARMREAAGAQLSGDFWQWVTDQWSAELLVEAQQKTFVARRTQRIGVRGESSSSAAAATVDASSTPDATAPPAGADDATDAAVAGGAGAGAPPMCLPWHDTPDGGQRQRGGEGKFAAEIKPWSGVASRVPLPLGAVRISSVEHAGGSFEDLLRPLAAVVAAAAAAEEKSTEKGFTGVDASQARFAESVALATAADAAIRLVVRGAFQAMARALHSDKAVAGGVSEAEEEGAEVSKAKRARDILSDPIKRRRYFAMANDETWAKEAANQEARNAAAAERRAGRTKDGQQSGEVNAAAAAEEEERHFQDHRARAEEEKRREADAQKRMKEKNASLYESKRAQERREEAGRGVNQKKKGEGKAEQWAANAEKLRALKKHRDGTGDGRGRSASTQLGGNLPNQCRAPVLDVMGDAVPAGQSDADGAEGGGKKTPKKRKKGTPYVVRVHFFVSQGAAAAAVDGFEVQAARWVGRGVRGEWSNFKDVTKEGPFRGFRSLTTGEYSAPSHGDVELPPGRVAVRVRAINGAGKGEWSMQQVTQLGDYEEEEAAKGGEEETLAAAEEKPAQTLERVQAEHAEALEARAQPRDALHELVSAVTSLGEGWEETDEGWAQRVVSGGGGGGGGGGPVCDTIRLEELEVRLAAVAPAKTRLAEMLARMKREVSVKVPRSMDPYKLHLKEEQGLGAEQIAAEVKRVMDKTFAVAQELKKSEVDDAAGRLDDAAAVEAAGAKLVSEVKTRVELAAKRRATLSPWESRLGRPKAIDAIIAAARDALNDPIAWPVPGVQPPKQAAAAAAAGGGGFFGGLFGSGKAAEKESDNDADAGVWGLPTLVADALYSACAASGYEVSAHASAFDRAERRKTQPSADHYKDAEESVVGWHTAADKGEDGAERRRGRWAELVELSAEAARRWGESMHAEAAAAAAAGGAGAVVAGPSTWRPSTAWPYGVGAPDPESIASIAERLDTGVAAADAAAARAEAFMCRVACSFA